MKIVSAIFAIIVLVLDEIGVAQSFQNLNFEQANVSGYSVNASDVPISAALPGWTGFYASSTFGTNQVSQVWYDGISIGGAFISVNDTNTGFGFKPIEGKFSVYLFSQGLVSPAFSMISQTGLVPNGTMSLQAKMVFGGPAPVIMLGGQTINMIPLATFPAYTLFGGDISAFAGQVATLSFTEPPPAFSSPSSLLLDSIVFSPQQIPEPSSLALFGVVTLIFSFFHRRHSSR